MLDVHYPTRLPFGSRVVDLALPKVMGILNVTPDSFSDGGQFSRLDAALRHVESMVEAGAAFIDVGGESTRPGAAHVTRSEELDRVAPVVEAIVQRFDVVVSLDTSTPEVMTEGARLGAGLINDVRSLMRPRALEAAAATGLPVCLMHMVGEPTTMQDNPQYDNVVEAVHAFLKARIAACAQAGIEQHRLIIDPGFGFAKTLQHNLVLFKRMDELADLGCPLLVGVSRKSMIGQTLSRPVQGRLAGSLALAALALAKGARILRVHDVAETVDVVRMIAAVEAAE
ncbi:dihydropteroate synthase [Pseudomonas matsuisoli]|uniref:Dihydropteroate synthase n=1 Tax=Pseudomonas matsuisoli TaxID=1515666 RepID=A0A917PY56_9PSED|nr:dihydropteroate synthase [Pseudomonas matsuisoli]GGJ99926.1 dihydropteroate synthase [Pseudomonas matsuisoli]